MTVTEYRPLLTAAQRSPTPGETPCSDACSVLDTTELRWFVSGPLPVDLGRWFIGSSGVFEERCDTYLLDGRSDVGVKRRSRETMEVKVRQSLDGWMQLGDGLGGELEVWRKWSPVEGLVDDGSDGHWVDVCKSIVKRRFSWDGTEVAYSSVASGAGCDVEVAEVTVGAVQTWSFAFAAFGPPSTRRDSLLASWQGLMAAARRPESFGLGSGRTMGYPEWLAL